MLEQNSTKVKRKIRKAVDGVSACLSVPDYKFVLEMLSGALSSCSLNLMELSRSLKEDIDIKHTHKRLQRHVSKSGFLLDSANKYIQRQSAKQINNDSFIYLDGGDLTYNQARSYEQMTIVHDGSTGKLKPGYPLNMIVCRNGKERAFPVSLDIFHRNDGYTSDNTQTYKMISQFMSLHGNKGIWTMDRGYDHYKIMDYIMQRRGQFNIRLVGNRHLRCGGQALRADKLAHSINRRHSFEDGKYGYKHCYLKEYPVTLIYYQCEKTDLILLNSGHISKSRIIKQRIEGYFSRWGVEEGYRFIKQSFGIESAQVKSFGGIRCLLGVAMLGWQVLVDVSKDAELEQIVKKEAKMYVTKEITFDYYRIIRGIKAIFSYCREMFRYRKQKSKHKTLTIEDFLPKQNRFAACY